MVIYEDIFRAFNKADVKYVLVGGLAVNLLGNLRSTADMDILVHMSDENLAKIVKILKNKGYRVKQPVDPMGIADEAIRRDWIKNKHMKAFNFYKEGELKEVDIIIDSPVSYQEAKRCARYIKSGNIVLPVVSVAKLIKMKKNTGRLVDKLDIRQLSQIQRIRKAK